MSQQKTCAQIFTVALFITAQKRKQYKRPSTDEWINKMKWTNKISIESPIIQQYKEKNRDTHFIGVSDINRICTF